MVCPKLRERECHDQEIENAHHSLLLLSLDNLPLRHRVVIFHRPMHRRKRRRYLPYQGTVGTILELEDLEKWHNAATDLVMMRTSPHCGAFQGRPV